MTRFIFLVTVLLFNGIVSAVPVVDVTENDQTQQPLVQSTQAQQQQIDTSDMSVEQRLTRLEQLINTQGQMKLLSRLNQLQEQVEILQGQNEILRHQVQKLQIQQRNVYMNLDQRVTALENGKPLKHPKSLFALKTIGDNDQSAYQTAYNLIASRQYAQAVTALAAFIKQYPKSTYVPNALYWQGEVLTVQGKNSQAKAILQQLVQNYPNNPKVADAQLKLASIAVDNNQLAQASQQLQEIIKQYPNSSAATLAANKLRQLEVPDSASSE